MNLADKIYIFDTTLRDGEQAPGVALTVDEKIQIAQKLDKLGVDKIEAGFPVSSNGERKAAKELNSLGLNATVLGLARSVQKDIDAVLDSGLDYILLSVLLHCIGTINLKCLKKKSLKQLLNLLNMQKIMD
mgnify:CR=1 FL=1